MALPTSTSSYFVDTQGVSSDAIFNAAADRMIPLESPRASAPPPPPTTEERLKALEEQRMATAPNNFEDPNYWNQGVEQVSAPAPQLIIPTAPEQQGRLPRTVEELHQHTQQVVTGTLTQLQQHQMAINSMENTLRSKFRGHKDYANWEEIGAGHYRNLIASGVDRNTAYRQSVEHIQNLSAQGVQPPKRSLVPSPNAGHGAHFNGEGDGSLRPDERGMQARIGFYSEEQRNKDLKQYIHDRNMDSEYYKTRGSFGTSLQEKYAKLFDE